MRSITMSGPGQVELLPSVPDTRPPGPLELTGRTLCSLVSPGTELALYRGSTRDGRFPASPGYAAVISVEAVGEAVLDIRPGDLALCMAPHASRGRVRREKCARVPGALAPEKAVFARLMTVSMSTLSTTRARPPAEVLVTGLGVVGHLAAQIFALCGYRVLACDPLASRRELATQLGLKNVAATVPEGAPFDLAIECSGNEQAVLASARAVRKGGEVVLVGVPWIRRTDLSMFELLHVLFHGYVHLRSGWEWELPLQPQDFAPASIQSNLEGALRWLADGWVRTEGLCFVRSPEECASVYAGLVRQQHQELTCLFDWRLVRNTD